MSYSGDGTTRDWRLGTPFVGKISSMRETDTGQFVRTLRTFDGKTFRMKIVFINRMWWRTVILGFVPSASLSVCLFLYAEHFGQKRYCELYKGPSFKLTLLYL